MNSYSKYVVPVFDSIHTCGHGCFIGDCFLTSGHVIGNETKHIYWNGNEIYLNPQDAISLQQISNHKDDAAQNDFALFKCNGINSPLRLSSSMPPIGFTLECVTYIPDNDTSSIDGFLRKIRCTGRVIDQYHHFFSCHMDFPLKEGSSGSPVIKNDIVWGILCGLDDSHGEDALFFQSSAFIR